MSFEISTEIYFFCQNVFANYEAAGISIENIRKNGENGRGFFFGELSSRSNIRLELL